MKFNDVIGIDVSKKTLDAFIYSSQAKNCFENNKIGFKNMVSWIKNNSTFSQIRSVFVFEFTGIYSNNLALYLDSNNFKFCMVPGLDIKRSIGIARGKDDQIDAKRIAIYGYRLKEELIPMELPQKDISKLKSLMTLKKQLIRQRAAFKAKLKEQKLVFNSKEYKLIFNIQEQLINYLSKKIIMLENEILTIIKNNEHLKNNFKLIKSIKGIGDQSAITLIIVTNNFKKFKSWRKFAAYCGTAPFPYQSGTSLKGRTRVSNLANKDIKSIMHMCAMAAIQHNPEMKEYFQKRTLEGKNKMSTINIIRNKLLARIFATIKRQTPYVNTMKFVA
ncbi:transposase [Aquimarina aggregata]|uniref:Transposase n=1 Tax=Aquimarina aggregata TaxID=1642818 RepID=A0A162XAY1_9FLAO|nr:IS110 family transposase [Aquimarina aggregata]KZS38527.1 transposase [Aquimarina aggregata]